MLKVSVIICTHNPRKQYFECVLKALESQTLPKDQWELLIIDNASEVSLINEWSLSWHPCGRHIRENHLGLTPARIRGICEAAAEVIVFVDDDNVLSADYLSVALELMDSHPWIGALGGSTVGEFETQPENWWKGRLENLAILEVKKRAWACLAGMDSINLFMPCGAGMVIRKSAASRWAENVAKDPLRIGLGRKGNSLTGYDDIDMVLFVCSTGLAIGRFPELSLTHLIPSGRLNKSYFIKLTEGNATSSAIFRYLREGILPNMEDQALQSCRSEQLLALYKKFRKLLTRAASEDTFEEDLKNASRRGEREALRIIEEFQKSRG